MVEKGIRENRKITNKVVSKESGVPLATYGRLAATREDFFVNSNTFKKLVEYFEVAPGGLFKIVDEVDE
jgi:hypothetical protein